MKRTYIIPDLTKIHICSAGVIATSPSPITQGQGVEDEHGESKAFGGSLFEEDTTPWE